MKALILCAGLGTRLSALAEDLPKPMLPLHGKPLLEYNIRYLVRHDFDQIAINLHHKPEVIQTTFGNGSALGASIHYAFEDHLLGTAGAVKNLEAFLGTEEDFLVLYGDLLVDQDLHVMLKAHREKHACATLLLHQRERSNSLVQMDADRRITGFLERPTEAQRRAFPFPWVNSGLQLLNRRMLDYIPANHPADLPRDVYVATFEHERLFGYPLTGFRIAIDSPEHYRAAQEAVRRGRYSCVAGQLDAS